VSRGSAVRLVLAVAVVAAGLLAVAGATGLAIAVAAGGGVVALVLALQRRSGPTVPAGHQPAVRESDRPVVREGDRPAAPEVDHPAVRISVRSHLSQVLPASSERGPEPVHVPVTGHVVVLDVRPPQSGPVRVTALGAQVVERRPLDTDGVSMALAKPPDLVYSADLQEAAERSARSFEPLPVPHFEVLLDEDPPIVRRTLLAPDTYAHPGVALPLEVAGPSITTIFLAPLTGAEDLVVWRLAVTLSAGGAPDVTRSWELQTTGRTGWRTFSPGGGEPADTPAHEITDHWGRRVP
jgi:hypothetical protein